MDPIEFAKKLRAKLAAKDARADEREILRETEAIARAPGPTIHEQAPARTTEAPRGDLDGSLGPLTDLLSEVFGTRFVAMPVLQAAFKRFLASKKIKSSATIDRPGFLKFTPAGPFPSGPRQKDEHVHGVFRNKPPVDGVYAVWYDDRPNTLLVKIDSEGFELGQALYQAAREAGVEVSTLARKRFEQGSRGVVRAGRKTKGPRQYEWRWYTFDLLGDGKKNPWEINDVYRTTESVILEEDLTLQLNDADQQAILEAMSDAGIILDLDTWKKRVKILDEGDGILRFVDTRLKNKPLGEIRIDAIVGIGENE